jgi:hypothetical protein
MTMKKVWCVVFLCLSLSSLALAGSQLGIRPYGKVGILLTPPSADDLDYKSAAGENMDKYLDMNKTDFGVGMQLLLNKTVSESFRKTTWGLDVGFQKLFSSKFDTHSSDLASIYEDYSTDNESDLYALIFAEFRSEKSPLFFQAGGGVHLVFWSFNKHYSSIYTTEENSSGGSAFDLGLFAAAGTNLKSNGKLQIPVLVRLDCILRYGLLVMPSIMVGITF